MEQSGEVQPVFSLTMVKLESDGAHKLASTALNLAIQNKVKSDTEKATTENQQEEFQRKTQDEIAALKQEIAVLKRQQQVVNINAPMYIINSPHRVPPGNEQGNMQQQSSVHGNLREVMEVISGCPQWGNPPPPSGGDSGNESAVVSKTQEP